MMGEEIVEEMREEMGMAMEEEMEEAVVVVMMVVMINNHDGSDHADCDISTLSKQIAISFRS
jgi:hypothetical protein